MQNFVFDMLELFCWVNLSILGSNERKLPKFSLYEDFQSKFQQLNDLEQKM